MTHNRKKFKNLCFEVLGCSLLKAEGFYCNLDVLYEGLGISKLKIQTKNYQSSSGHQTTGSGLDPYSARNSAYNAGSGSAINESGSETLFLKVDHKKMIVGNR